MKVISKIVSQLMLTFVQFKMATVGYSSFFDCRKYVGSCNNTAPDIRILYSKRWSWDASSSGCSCSRGVVYIVGHICSELGEQESMGSVYQAVVYPT